MTECLVANSTALFEFEFGGPQGAHIQVPVDSWLYPVHDYKGNPVLRNGKPLCSVDIETNDDLADYPALFDMTFLYNMYSVFDVENNQLSIAQANFNPGPENIVRHHLAFPSLF